jgi:hypothetical protein
MNDWEHRDLLVSPINRSRSGAERLGFPAG